MKGWVLRPLSRLVIGIAAVTIVIAGAIRLDQHRLRWRAERLQSDIRSLELRKSTYADALRLEHYWLDDAKEGVCRPSWCDLQIFLNNAGCQHVEFLVNHPAAFVLYRGLGGRIAGVYAFIRVRDNLLWEKGIGLGVDTWSTEPDGRHVQYDLEGSVGTDSLTRVSARHPEYQIGGPNACTSCKEGYVKFTPFADPRDVLRLTDLNFTCITRWRQCTDQAEILPTAWKELRAEAAEGTQNIRYSCTTGMIRVLSRQTHSVDLVKVIKLKLVGELPLLMTVHRIPGGISQPAELWQELSLVADTSEGFHLGDRLLLLDGACRAIPATPENMSAARLGASEGWISPAHPLNLPFNFAPRKPKIDMR